MKMKLTFAIGLGVVSALVAPGINAGAHAGPSGQLTPTVTTPPAVVSRMSPGVPDATVGDPLPGQVTDAEKNAPGVPEIVVPAKKQTLAEVRARLRMERRNSADKTTTVTAYQCPDGEIYLTVTHVFLAPPGAKNSPPPPGGYDKLPEYSPEASCESGKSTK